MLYSEEVFGPVAPLVRFSTDEEAIKMCNDSEFGECFTIPRFFSFNFVLLEYFKLAFLSLT